VEYIVAKSSVDDIEAVPLLDINGFAGPLDLMIKRLFDLIVSVFVILVGLPLILLNIVAGARICKRKILGADGRPLGVFVFEGGFGFMKSAPLYVSVLAGKLSIVGSEIRDFKEGEFHPTYKPGLTGLVQVKLKEKEHGLSQKEKDYYNLYYIKNQSVITDLQIITRSIF
jgi:lipopolysaccharide/colanic/teichoic acid biosynthesis glycosyltransferase